MDASGVVQRRVATNGIHLNVAQAGPEDGPPVLLLHGFPEFWYGWRHQIEALARLGYRVWAPDGRGYARSDKPQGRSAYRMEELLADVVGLIDAGGWERVRVVGHDWGGAVAWRLAERHPGRVERLTVINCPHPGVLGAALRRDPAQLLRSSYVFFFQLPGVPEAALRWRGYRMLARAMRGTSAPGSLSAEELAEYRRAWAEPGALTGMLNWYRAAPLSLPRLAGGPGRVRPPALLLWGTGDRFLGEALIEPTLARCDQGRLHRLEGVSHWAPWEAPGEVNAVLADWLGGRV